MKVEELIRALQAFPPDHRVVVECNVGYADIAAREIAIAANHRSSKCDDRGPLSCGVHAKPDRIFDQIEATETAVLIGRHHS
ncbi:hypothetical protein [Aromatoleum petrolei]|uniref:Uncharacterized protein n=1 Tax=Aromatoleum petrolei TaxID=76116 RepID=A0ABX1MRZ8_9RHOO|nr:hypothetical protein [Aromatoleum petrolei]NMF89995.1 hypothetical protein [Aromatoleum petrolei]QTQ36272.1 Uncharacterized protein ToN1_21250 [Aromatoleum petrolei]